MSQKLTQDTSLLRLETPLGTDVLIPVTFDGYERVSENFEWKINCLLNEGEDPVDPAKIIGKGCMLKVIHGSDETKFHGLCTDVDFKGFRMAYAVYEIKLRPWTWILTQETSCEIFHEKKPDDIIRAIFQDRNFTDFRFDTESTYSAIAYCVQYQETPYAFVSRLMEKYGMFSYFECEDSKHTLVITDAPSTLNDIGAAEAKIKYQANTGIGIREHRLYSWGSSYRLRTGKIEVDDYFYEKPNTKLEKTGKAKDSPSHSHKEQKRYVYPSGHYDPGEGQKLADVLMDIERADAERRFGVGNVPAVRAGFTFTLDEHPTKAENKKYFSVAVRHRGYVAIYITGKAGRGELLGPDLSFSDGDIKHPYLGSHGVSVNGYYIGEPEVADAAKAYKAPLATPWPTIPGAQTAEVIRDKSSPKDEEIDVDDKGRILVKFHWNKKEEKSDKCSCRVRVAQIWAGSGWGGVWIPRVGMEAVVEFLNGDPDRPLVTGTVYNGANESPINFPDDKTQSSIKSQSSKGGTSADNFNELRFEDKLDDEEIYIHAERDRKMIIEHDDDIEIGNNQSETITGSRTFELTGGDETITLKGDAGTKDKYGDGNAKNGHRKTTLKKGDETLTIEKGKRDTTIKMNDTKTITDGDDVTKVNMGHQKITIGQGNQTTKISLGKGTTEAMQSFEIKVGGSSIKLEPAKITIKSVQVEVVGNGTAKMTSPMTTVEGSGMLMAKGGLVKIN